MRFKIPQYGIGDRAYKGLVTNVFRVIIVIQVVRFFGLRGKMVLRVQEYR